MPKLEIEFNAPSIQAEMEFDTFMKEKSIVQVTLQASDGHTFNITLKKPMSTVRQGNGPALTLVPGSKPQ